ncbi:hypothetical protein [Actinomadura sp. NPDC000600]|uniref:hypothetical protein n=1 Tax=Actinomadura sp. NPDC000600 TaxID=3154262 RepID=UPI00339624EB
MIPRTTSTRAAAVLAAGALAIGGAATPASAAERGDFTPVPLPFFWPNNSLYDVAAASPDSVWIAGNQGELVIPGPIPGTGQSIPGNPVVRRWKGGSWVEYDLQGLSSRGTITDVDAVAPEDVWISGPKYGSGDGAPVPYAAHFTGSRFEQVALPSGARSANLQASAGGVRVATDTGFYRRTGDTWALITTLPDIRQHTSYIRADDDIWVLGTASATDETLAARHWDGRSWQTVPVHEPVPGTGFTDMLALSPTDAWATGISYRTSPATPVLMHWDGTAWTGVTTPPGLNALTRIAEGGDGTLWAIGHSLDEPAKPGLIRYSGGTWERVPATAVPNRKNFYASALAVVPGTGALWTLGTVDIGGPVVLTDGP